MNILTKGHFYCFFSRHFGASMSFLTFLNALWFQQRINSNQHSVAASCESNSESWNQPAEMLLMMVIVMQESGETE